MVKKAKITVYCCGLFLDLILSKRAGFSICRSNFSQGPYSKIIHTLVILVFCLFEGNPRCSSIRLATLTQKDCKYLLKSALKIFGLFFIRKFGIVDKGSYCDPEGPGFKSSQRLNVKVSRLNKRQNCPFF